MGEKMASLCLMLRGSSKTEAD